jgi:hypothetical protein
MSCPTIIRPRLHGTGRIWNWAEIRLRFVLPFTREPRNLRPLTGRIRVQTGEKGPSQLLPVPCKRGLKANIK